MAHLRSKYLNIFNSMGHRYMQDYFYNNQLLDLCILCIYTSIVYILRYIYIYIFEHLRMIQLKLSVQKCVRVEKNFLFIFYRKDKLYLRKKIYTLYCIMAILRGPCSYISLIYIWFKYLLIFYQSQSNLIYYLI